jgi:hypothetical protein
MSNRYYFLHAGSVAFDNKAVLFMGESYSGKSTMIYHLLKQGHSLISDDKLAIYDKDDKFFAVSSHPYHRPYRAIEDLGVKTNNFIQEDLPIDCIYYLYPVKKDQPIKIEPINGLQKFKYLRYSTEMDIPIYKKQKFKYISKIANNIPMYKIDIPRDLKLLDEVYKYIKLDQKNRRKKNDT